MELFVFDLDGTLLNAESVISDFTANTLNQLVERDVAFTVATGRSLHASQDVLSGHPFHLPHAFKNGVMIWDPRSEEVDHDNHLTRTCIEAVVELATTLPVTPFIFTLEEGNRHGVYHTPLCNSLEEKLVQRWMERHAVDIRPFDELPDGAEITNISSLGTTDHIDAIVEAVDATDHLIAYSGFALEDETRKWLDVHSSRASKGGAVTTLRDRLGASSVICFGDSDNDKSMFEVADESYATDNAKPDIKAMASGLLDCHSRDGVAHFLRERFALD